ncbi:MAG: hypothetical protein H7Y41_06890 [Hyphomonadaceae bacterium]|nr:hypothetical protein [Clostridia bacterium]
MHDKVRPGPISGCQNVKEAVCIHTDKVYDSCREKDCLEDLKVIFLCERDQRLIDNAINVKVRKAKIIWVFSDVEEVPFNEGFFTIDIKFFFEITLDVFTGVAPPTPVRGLATFDKKVILFGSEGKAKIFSSKFKDDEIDKQLCPKNNLPVAVIEVVEPIPLAARLADAHHHHHHHCCMDVSSIPQSVLSNFDVVPEQCEAQQNVFVSLGIFTIVKLERKVQLLIPVFDFCFPENECIEATADNPCELFDRIRFPFNEFFPPQKHDFQGAELFENTREPRC